MKKRWEIQGFGLGVNTMKFVCPYCKDWITSFPNNLPKKCPFCNKEVDGLDDYDAEELEGNK